MNNEKCPDDHTTQKFPHLLMSYEMEHMLAMSGCIKYLYAARIAVPAHFVSRLKRGVNRND
jgi:hypothetical protein